MSKIDIAAILLFIIGVVGDFMVLRGAEENKRWKWITGAIIIILSIIIMWILIYIKYR